jgi:arabinose-5-phosphate isomerase
LEQQAQSLVQVAAQQNESFLQALDTLVACTGRVVIMGIGKSGLVARKMVATLSSTGTPSLFVHPADALHGDLGIVQPGDVVILISQSGETAEVLHILPSLKAFGNTIIAITGGGSHSSLARSANVVINSAVDRETCPHNLAPTTSTLAVMALGDALAVSLMNMRGFTPQDFARYHPGGSLGRRLVTRVRDTMVTENLPFVSAAAFMNEVVWQMTRGRLGLAIVMDNQKLVGIVTDGDLRRALLKSHSLAHTTVTQVMTPQPVVVEANALVGEVEEFMRARRISSVLVRNPSHQIVGVFQIHRSLIEHEPHGARIAFMEES